MNRINKNNNIQWHKSHIFYGVISFICLAGIVWWFSFSWICIYNVPIYTVFLIFSLLICLLGSLIYDKIRKKRTKWIFAMPLIQLLILTGISFPITKWQIDSSLKKAQDIITQLENYNKKYEVYPETLIELEQKMGTQIPKKSNIGSKYQYEKDKSESYNISFISYYGKVAVYNKNQNRWKFVD